MNLTDTLKELSKDAGITEADMQGVKDLLDNVGSFFGASYNMVSVARAAIELRSDNDGSPVGHLVYDDDLFTFIPAQKKD